MKAVDYIRKGWTQEVLARDANGRKCWPLSSEAVEWCARGALIAAYGQMQRFVNMRRKLCKTIGVDCLVVWNDNRRRTKREVIEAMEKAGV